MDVGARLASLKAEAGSHSPGIRTIRQRIPELEIRVDACFLSNPHATDLFMEHIGRDVLDAGSLRELLEYYPSQNRVIAAHLEPVTGVPARNIVIGNGATELIEAVMRRFVTGTVLLPIPTFSAYYEFAVPGTQVRHHRLAKARDYALDIDGFAASVGESGASAAIVINPNNPTGGYLSLAELEELLERLRGLEIVVVDESFIHFAYEDDARRLVDLYPLTGRFPNLVLVKSMSKDFGVAGLRAGYAVMSSERVDALLGGGLLWNSNGLAEYFFALYSRPGFLGEYEVVRKRAIDETMALLREMSTLPGIRVYPTKASFVLVELLDGVSSEEFATRLLVDHGIYARDCADKIGLDGQYVRIASRGAKDNATVIHAMRSVLT